MPLPGQQATFLQAVLLQLRAELTTVSGLNDGNIFIAAEPRFLGDAYPGDQYVEIVPGAATDLYSGVGYGYIDDSVRIVIYHRLLIDRAEDDAERLTNSSLGILQLVDAIYAQLTNNFLTGLLTQPLRPMRREPGQSVAEQAAGWTVIERMFSFRYQVSYPDPQSMTS